MASYTQVDKYLFRNEDSGVFYVRKSFKKEGFRELFKSLGTDKISRARTLRDEAILEHQNHHLGIRVSARLDGSPTIGEVIDAYFQSIQNTRRKTTLKKRGEYFKELKTEFGALPVNLFNVKLWNKWLIGFRLRKTDRKTFFDYAKHMNLVLRFAYENQFITNLITVKNPDAGRETAFRVYTDTEIASLWNHMSENTRDQFILSYECFMRLREALYLTWDRIDLKTGLVTLRSADVKTGTKTGKGRQFFLTPNALDRLKDRYAKRVSKSPYVFPSRSDPSKPQHDNKTAWVATKRRAGIKGKGRWHDLRHSALTKALLEAKAEPVLVSEYAGVSMRTIQTVYLHSHAEQTKSVAGSVLVPGVMRREKGVKNGHEEE